MWFFEKLVNQTGNSLNAVYCTFQYVCQDIATEVSISENLTDYNNKLAFNPFMTEAVII